MIGCECFLVWLFLGVYNRKAFVRGRERCAVCTDTSNMQIRRVCEINNIAATHMHTNRKIYHIIWNACVYGQHYSFYLAYIQYIHRFVWFRQNVSCCSLNCNFFSSNPRRIGFHWSTVPQGMYAAKVLHVPMRQNRPLSRIHIHVNHLNASLG